jgi:hypothetical protein
MPNVRCASIICDSVTVSFGSGGNWTPVKPLSDHQTPADHALPPVPGGGVPVVEGDGVAAAPSRAVPGNPMFPQALIGATTKIAAADAILARLTAPGFVIRSRLSCSCGGPGMLS